MVSKFGKNSFEQTDKSDKSSYYGLTMRAAILEKWFGAAILEIWFGAAVLKSSRKD